jgi:hypothetical protein
MEMLILPASGLFYSPTLSLLVFMTLATRFDVLLVSAAMAVLTTFMARLASFLRIELIRGSFLMSGLSALAGNFPLFILIHRGEAAIAVAVAVAATFSAICAHLYLQFGRYFLGAVCKVFKQRGLDPSHETRDIKFSVLLKFSSFRTAAHTSSDRPPRYPVICVKADANAQRHPSYFDSR